MMITFTGTRAGMTKEQRVRVAEVFRELRIPNELTFLIHGACHGADRQAHEMIVRRIMYPSNEEQMAWALRVRGEGDFIEPIEGAPEGREIRRNRRMVDRGRVVVATPSGKVNIPRGSGTWATIRYAVKLEKTLYICYPDGTLDTRNK